MNEDWYVPYHEIKASLDASQTAIHSILYEKLAVKKICSKWISHNVTEAQKEVRANWCKEMLKKFKWGTAKSIYNIIKGDENWIHSCEMKTKQQSTV